MGTTLGSVPHAIRLKMRDNVTCHWCGALWASEVDHVHPVAQGGADVTGNFVKACRRCNQNKSGRNPHQWREARLAKGLSWPPVDCQFVVADLVAGLPLTDGECVYAAVRARDVRMMTVIEAVHDRYYAERARDPEVDREELRRIAQEFRHRAIRLTVSPSRGGR